MSRSKGLSHLDSTGPEDAFEKTRETESERKNTKEGEKKKCKDVRGKGVN